MLDRPFTDAELDAAITQIAEPGRLRAAQDLVARKAPALQRVLAAALTDGGWFEGGHEQAVREAAAHPEATERLTAVRTLIAEETRLGMFVGVAVGFELAQELAHVGPRGPDPDSQPTEED